MRTLMLFCLLSIAVQSTAQQYIPFPTSNATWRYRGYSMYLGNMKTGVQDMLFIIDGSDTTIKGNMYKKVYLRSYSMVDTTHSPNVFNPPVYNVIADSIDKYYAALREDNKKIYMNGVYTFSGYDTVERLYYDFNLQIGDTVHSANLSLNGAIVTGFDSLKIGTKYHRRIKTTSIGFRSKDLIEGVGPASLQLFNQENGQNIVTLHCFTNNNGSYVNDTFKCSYIFPYGTPTIVNAAEKVQPKVYPSPFNDIITITGITKGNTTIYNSLGIKVMELKINGATTINTGSIPSGIYYLILTDADNNIISRHKTIKE